jgi:ribonuclease BN (tRNA processing enzyme)
MRIIFLGTNGWYDTDTGNTICILIETDGFHIILDAGNGLYKADRYIRDDKPIYMFLSHFHLDHIAGLHVLNKFKFGRELNIFGPQGTRDVLRLIINEPFTVPLSALPFKVLLHDLPDEMDVVPFPLQTRRLLHSSLTLGYRFEIDKKVIAYCPDTGYCEQAVELSTRADILIAECAYKAGQRNPKWPHLNPEDAARLARESSAKRLMLVHFDAHLYKNIDARKYAEKVAKTIFKNTHAAVDGLVVKL